MVAGLWTNTPWWTISGGSQPKIPSYKTSVDLCDKSFRDFLLGFSSADWASLSTIERCQLITLIRVAFVQVTTGYLPQNEEAIAALAYAVSNVGEKAAGSCICN